MTILLILIVLLLLLILWMLVRGQFAHPGAGASASPSPQPAIPDQIPSQGIASFLSARLAGTPADGSTSTAGAAGAVVWVDSGDEVLVHLDSVQTEIVGDCVLVSIDLETDQTGRTPLVIAFSLGQSADGSLIAATDEFPRGNGLLAARWGMVVQQAMWTALISLADDHASERNQAPHGFSVKNGSLQMHAGAPFTLT